MTFNFDGADILVIIIVVILLFLFKRLDKTGRSLEKVRKYAEKSKNELDAIVRERVLEMKDLAVDLEVQEKTNREILIRTEAAREEILLKSEELEERVAKIEEHEKALEELNELALRVDENLMRLKAESEYVDQVGSRLKEVKEKLSSLEEKDEKRFNAFRQEMFGAVKSDVENLQRTVEDTSRELTLFRETLDQINARRDQEVSERIELFREELENIEEDYKERLQKVAEEGEKLEDDAFRALNDKISSRTEMLENNWLSGLNELKENVSQTVAEIKQTLEDTRSEIKISENDFRTIEENLNNLSSGLSGRLEDLGNSIDSIVEKKELEILETLESRQDSYRKTVESRFEKLEEFISGMDGLFETLKASQKQLMQNIEETFIAFDDELKEKRAVEKAALTEEAEEMRRQMEELEHGLDELKSRAYENVSEKLQVFEDDFFAALKARDEEIKISFEDWRKNIEIELGDMGVKAAREREETEQRYSAELKQRFTDLQTRVLGQFEEFQDQVDQFRDSINIRIKTSEENLSVLRDELFNRITEEKNKSFEEFERVYDVFNREVNEKFAKANKTIGKKLSDFSFDIDSRHKELTAEYEATRDEINIWKERVEIGMQEVQKAVEDSINTAKSDFDLMLSQLKDEYSAKTEQLVLESREERSALSKEISDMEEAVSGLSIELTEKTRDSLDNLKQQSENFLFEFRRNAAEAREELEKKVRDLRQGIQEAKDKAEAGRKEMESHLEREYNRLMKNLDDIDRRQRQFILETRVFERADEMKEALEADIAELNRQLGTVAESRSEIQKINNQYERAVSLYDEVSGKIARFLSEQQKVENLENKIARIGSLSESVDLKLQRITEVNDTIQDLQVRLKQLEDLHEDMVARYERLAEKSRVLDTTTSSVDKNFERMDKIEGIIRDMAEQLVPLKNSLNEALSAQRRLESAGDKIDLIVNKAADLDSTLKDLDEKMETLAKAREWLARTETRLVEINNETQQKIKLLGTLSRRDRGLRKSPGSPDLSTREVVVKLAREGWKSDEIARQTKLSQGEVELILELTPKS